MYAEPDRDAVFVRIADEAHSLGGATPADSYLDIEKIIDGRQEVRAPTRSTPATASSPRTPTSPRPSSTPGWSGSARRRARSRTSATRSRRATSPRRSGAPLAPGTKDPLENADEAVAFAEEHGLPIAIKAAFGGGGRGLKVAREMKEVADAFESAVREAITRLRPRRVLRREVPRPAAPRRDPVPGRPARQRRRRLHPRLLAAAPPPEAGRGGAGAVPHRRPGRPALRVLQGDPARGRLRRRRHLRVPRRQGRHDLLPRGQHPAAGRALRVRGGHRHRPGPRDVPDRRRRGARLRRPRDPRSLDRVPHQRRGRRPQLHAGPRHAHRVEPAAGARRPARRRLRERRDHPRFLRLPHRQADRHRTRPHPGAGALAPRPRRVRRRRHADGDPVPPGGRRRPGVHR